MKSLFLTTPHEDGLSDILYNGLVNNGIEVIDFPRKPFYHCQDINGETRTYDYQDEEVVEDSNGTMTLSDGTKSHRKFNTVSKDSIINSVNPLDDDYDFVIVSSAQAHNDEFLNRIRTQKRVPMYFLDGRDDPFLLKAFSDYNLYFKRELYADSSAVVRKFKALKKLGFSYYNKLKVIAPVSIPGTIFNLFNPKLVQKKVIPLNLSINDHKFKKSKGEKEFDFSFIGSPNTPYRIEISRRLEKLALRHDLKVFLNLTELRNNKNPLIPWLDYVDIVQKSKMSLSLPGAGFDTFRYWEIPYYGTCLVSPYLPIEIPHNFKDMQSSIFFSSFSQLENKILKVLKNDSWEDIAMEGHRDFEKYHSSEQRAKRFLESVKQCALE